MKVVPCKGYVIAEPIVSNLGGFEVVEASQVLIKGKVLVSEDDNIKNNDFIVFNRSESYEYTFSSLGKVIIVPIKEILVVEKE